MIASSSTCVCACVSECHRHPSALIDALSLPLTLYSAVFARPSLSARSLRLCSLRLCSLRRLSLSSRLLHRLSISSPPPSTLSTLSSALAPSALSLQRSSLLNAHSVDSLSLSALAILLYALSLSMSHGSAVSHPRRPRCLPPFHPQPFSGSAYPPPARPICDRSSSSLDVTNVSAVRRQLGCFLVCVCVYGLGLL